jgi:hypothetical protein
MFDPIQLTHTRFRIHSSDPSLEVVWRGGGRFHVTGEVTGEPWSELDVETPSDAFEVHLECHSTPEHVVAQIKRALPRGIIVTQQETAEGVEFTLDDAVVPAARPPRVRILTSDTHQRIKQLEENKVEFVGNTGHPCHVTVFCDTRRVTLALDAECSAKRTAAYVAANIPHGFRAVVDGPVLSVWKDADFFEMVA